jgi:leucyl/phenylalanyl-tRNA---protein transferase
MSARLTPELLVRAYAAGVFPMAESASSSDIFWVDPKKRGIFPLDAFHVSHSLAKAVRKAPYEIRIDYDFANIMQHCAEQTPQRHATWINGDILSSYTMLHEAGFAHSVECWEHDRLVGGLYGVSLKGAFFGESMFSRATDASKIALVHLVARLRVGGYQLLDTQFITDHLARLGAIEVAHKKYHQMLKAALTKDADFNRIAGFGPLDGDMILGFACD